MDGPDGRQGDGSGRLVLAGKLWGTMDVPGRRHLGGTHSRVAGAPDAPSGEAAAPAGPAPSAADAGIHLRGFITARAPRKRLAPRWKPPHLRAGGGNPARLNRYRSGTRISVRGAPTFGRRPAGASWSLRLVLTNPHGVNSRTSGSLRTLRAGIRRYREWGVREEATRCPSMGSQ